MYRNIEDFKEEWTSNAQGTLNVFKALQTAKLDQAIVEGHNSLGWLADHLIGAAGMFAGMVGLDMPKFSFPSETAEEIVEKYEAVLAAIQSQLEDKNDEWLLEEVKGFYGPIPRGKLLRIMIDHQTHHRGQMTVLLRQAGLTVPGIMGPTKEMSK